MIEIELEARLSARPKDVWTIVEDVRRLPMWFAFCDGAELVSGSGVGRKQRTYGRWRSKRFEVDQVVTAYEPNRQLSWRHEAERLDGKPAPRFSAETTFSVWLEPDGGGTRVRLVSQQRPASRLRGFLMRASARETEMKMRKSLDRLTMVAAAM